MMLVTEIEEVSKNKCKIFLNGEFAFVLYKGELSTYHIKKGKEIPKVDTRRQSWQVPRTEVRVTPDDAIHSEIC